MVGFAFARFGMKDSERFIQGGGRFGFLCLDQFLDQD